MRIGLNLMLFGVNPTDPTMLRALEPLKHMGYHGVEVPLLKRPMGGFSALGRQLDDLGLQRTASTALAAATDPSSADPAVREAALATLLRAIDDAHTLGATHLVGPLYAGLGVFTGRPPTTAELDRAADCLRLAAQHAALANITLGLEFLNRHETHLVNTAAAALALVERIGHSNCGVHYDTHHAHIEEADVSQALLHAAPRLVHVHVSENHRGIPGTGQVDWNMTFSTLHRIGYDGWLTIEAFGQAEPELLAATRVWRPVFDDPLTLAHQGLAFIRRNWTR